MDELVEKWETIILNNAKNICEVNVANRRKFLTDEARIIKIVINRKFRTYKYLTRINDVLNALETLNEIKRLKKELTKLIKIDN